MFLGLTSKLGMYFHFCLCSHLTDEGVKSQREGCDSDKSVSFKVTRGDSSAASSCPLCGQPGDVIYRTKVTICGKETTITP